MELVLLAQKSQPAEVTRSTTEKKSIHHRECDVNTVINSLLGSVLHQKCTLKGQLSVSNQLHHSESHPGDVIWKYVLLLPYLNYSSGWVTRPWMFISINTQSSDLCCRGSFLQNYFSSSLLSVSVSPSQTRPSDTQSPFIHPPVLLYISSTKSFLLNTF